MERILQRGGGRLLTSTKSSKIPSCTRGLILTPTRELAAQCLGMMTAMGKFTNLRAALIVGGAKNIASQVSRYLQNNQVYTKARLSNLPWRYDLFYDRHSPPLHSQEYK